MRGRLTMDWCQQYTRELLALTKGWSQFADVPRGQRQTCAAIGRKLHSMGGKDAMQDAYRKAKAANRAAGVIQAYWHGIGDWQW